MMLNKKPNINNANKSEPENDDDGDSEDTGSSDECLLDMLGLTTMESLAIENNETRRNDVVETEESCIIIKNNNKKNLTLPSFSKSSLECMVKSHRLNYLYEQEGVCVFPPEFSIPANHMRQLTEELIWNQSLQSDRTYETIKVFKNGEIQHRRTLTRLENFVDANEGWRELCHNYLRTILSAALGVEMVLFKEKLNLKPPLGSGFAPHLDSPSLRVALGKDGPQTFCTVMVAIDDMTPNNGCLRIVKGPFSEQNHCDVIEPEENGNPDAGGRAGAIPTEIADNMHFENIICKGGTVAAFNGWAPHRSAANTSPFPRRAVFLTYNPKSEGDFHTSYYKEMDRLRSEWRQSVGLAERQQRMEDEKFELEALQSIPKI